MKSTTVFVPLIMTIVIAQQTFSTPRTATTTPRTTTTWTTTQRTTPWTTGRPAVNLNGLMATLSSREGAISFYPPYYPPDPSYTHPYRTTTTRPYRTTTTRRYTITTRPYTTTTRRYTTTTTRPYTTTTTRPYTTTTTRRYTTTTRPYYTTATRPYTTRPYYTTTPPWTTPPLTRGLSVCLRYLTDSSLYLTINPQGSNRVTLSGSDLYQLSYGRWGTTLLMNANIKILPDVAPDIWTRVCLTMDFMKKVTQVFRESNMSIRKRLLEAYSWQIEPVIQFSGFTGQVTDIQMWDYPLNYREVTEYMDGGVYRMYRGSVLTWSYISYSNGGNMLLEEVYEIQAKLPIRGRGRRLRERKKSSGLGFNMRERKRQRL